MTRELFTTRVGANGRVTLRRDHLAHLGVSPGDKLTIEILDDQSVVIRRAKEHGISKLFGMLEVEGCSTVSIDEMNEAIAKGWAGER